MLFLQQKVTFKLFLLNNLCRVSDNVKLLSTGLKNISSIFFNVHRRRIKTYSISVPVASSTVLAINICQSAIEAIIFNGIFVFHFWSNKNFSAV